MQNSLIALISFTALASLLWYGLRPKTGWFWRMQRKLRVSDRILMEDALKYFTNCEFENETATLKGAAGCLGISEGEAGRIVSQLAEHNLISIDGNGFHLSGPGRSYGIRMIRAHRLYETYMSETSGYRENEWHDQADQAEHRLSDSEISALDQRLNYPVHDPHGDPIPTPEGELSMPEEKCSLSALGVDTSGVIVHMEDEPAEIYSQLIAEGLYPGLMLRVLEADSKRIRFWAGDDEHVLSPLLATSVQVVPHELEQRGTMPVPDQKTTVRKKRSLADCETGTRARIRALSPRISGTERRRLMDLGFLPGTEVEIELTSAAGDPMAFRIRGTLIALRRIQAEQIFIEKPETDKQSEGAA